MSLVNSEIISADLVAVKAKREATYGVAQATTAADGVMLSNFSIKPIKVETADSNIVTGTTGNSPKHLKYVMAECSFDIELAASGVAKTPPALGIFLTACGFDQVISDTPAQVEYRLTDNLQTQDSVQFETFLADRNVQMLGCRGNCKITFMEDEVLKVNISLVGQYKEPTSGTFSRVDYAAFKRSLLVNPDNVTLCKIANKDVVLHKIEFDAGMKAERVPAVNQKLIAHTAQAPTCSSTIRLPKLASWNIENDVTSLAQSKVQWAIGTSPNAVEMDIYQQLVDMDITDDTPRKVNLTHHPVPEAATTGTVLRFK